MVTATSLRIYRPIVAIPFLVAGFWFFSNKGCVPDSDLKPTTALVLAATPVPQPLDPRMSYSGKPDYVAGQAPPQPLGHTTKSLTRAADLLKQAATALDKNERLAVQLILQAIAILKRDVIHALIAPHADTVSTTPTELQADQGFDVLASTSGGF